MPATILIFHSVVAWQAAAQLDSLKIEDAVFTSTAINQTSGCMWVPLSKSVTFVQPQVSIRQRSDERGPHQSCNFSELKDFGRSHILSTLRHLMFSAMLPGPSVEARQVRPVRPAAVSDHPRPCGAFFESGAHSALLKLAGVAPLVYACGARSRRRGNPKNPKRHLF